MLKELYEVIYLLKFSSYLIKYQIFFAFWMHSMACGILVPQAGIEHVSPVVEAWSFNYCTTREVPIKFSI